MASKPGRYTFNEYNNEPRIRLINKENSLIENVSQIEAFHLLRNGFCKLLLVTPPTIQFELESHEWLSKFKCQKPPKWFRESTRWLAARKTNLYGNYHILHPDGHVMFHCDAQKALWYLNRNLVEIVSDDPPTLKLNFEPGGAGHIGDKYYLAPKINQCVCCGVVQDLNRHHVMPRVFRKHMPDEIKDHNYHDVLLLCVDCHCRYEIEASKLKKEICNEYGISTDENGGPEYDSDIGAVRGSARALLHYKDVIPEPRKSQLFEIVCKFCENPTDDDLARLASLNPWAVCGRQKVSYGQLVVEKIEAEGRIQEFTERWRAHFVQSMNPQYLPEYWNVSKPLVRDRVRPKIAKSEPNDNGDPLC